MKRLQIFIFSFLIMGYSFADTAFRWTNSTGAAENINDVPFLTGEATVFTFLDFDLTAAPSYQTHASIPGAFQVNISDIPSIIDFQPITVAPFGAPAPWGVLANITEVGSGRAGKTAYAIVADGSGLSSISIGDFIGAADNSYTVNDLGSPPGTTQLFDPGAVKTYVEVIPEPTTIAVLLMGLLGLIGFRKHLRK